MAVVRQGMIGNTKWEIRDDSFRHLTEEERQARRDAAAEEIGRIYMKSMRRKMERGEVVE